MHCKIYVRVSGLKGLVLGLTSGFRAQAFKYPEVWGVSAVMLNGGRFATDSESPEAHHSTSEPLSKLLEGHYIGNYIGDYYKGY